MINNPRIVMFGEIVVDEDSQCVFEPWMDKDANTFGWAADPQQLEGKNYVYLAPVLESGSSKPRFYLYIGPHGDPRRDRRLGPYDFDGTSLPYE